MPTLHTCITLFLSEYKPTTRKSYYTPLNRLARFVGPDRPLDQVMPQHVLEFLAHVRTLDLTVRTYNKYVQTIKTFFNWTVNHQFLPSSPAGAVHRRQYRKSRRDKALPDDLYEQLLDYVRHYPRNLALILFLGDTGCRIGGAASLQWEHVEFDEHRAIVTEKGDKTRPTFFGGECAQALRKWHLMQNRKPGANYVFSRTGQAIKSGHLGHHFRRLCIGAGIGSWGPHSLRHRKGHQLADHKIAPSIAAQALGHESVQVTLEYYYPEDFERVQAALEQLAHQKPAPSQKIINMKRKSGGA
jgi:integrase